MSRVGDLAIHPRLQADRAEYMIGTIIITRHIDQRVGMGRPAQQRAEQGERERERRVLVFMRIDGLFNRIKKCPLRHDRRKL